MVNNDLGDLDTLNMNKYDRPFVTVDTLIFTIKDNDLKILLVKRKNSPFKDKFAIPGGFVSMDKSLEESAKLKLLEKTGVKDVYLEQLYSFGEPKRDPRGRVITVTYFALLNPEKLKDMITSDKLNNNANNNLNTNDKDSVQWFSSLKIPQLAFDHREIIDYAMKRLKWKFEYTPIAFSLLPKKFTMTQLQELYETVFNQKFDKRNFRKKILSLDILEEQEVMRDVSFRPPQLYSLKNNVDDIINILTIPK